MPRNVGLQVLRGLLANMPVLLDGEFYFAEDTGQLYVGLNGDDYPVGGPTAVQVSGHVNPNNYVEPNSDGSLNVSLGTTNTAAVLKTAQLVSGNNTLQTILTYTVTAGKTLFLEYFDLQGYLTTLSATPTVLGTVIIQIAGVTVYTANFVQSNAADQSIPARIMLSQPIPIAGGTVIVVKVTPASSASMTWTANFGGYEK